MIKCEICQEELHYEWTCRGHHIYSRWSMDPKWLCIGCSKKPGACFRSDGSVGVTFLGGPIDEQRRVVECGTLGIGYRVSVIEHSECHDVQYLFDWDLGFFVFKGKI